MRYLAHDGIYCEDGIATAAISEAAERLQELDQKLTESEEYADRLVEGMPYLPKDIEILREANGLFADENEQYKQYIRILQDENEKIINENTALQNQVKRLHARTSPNDRRIWL